MANIMTTRVPDELQRILKEYASNTGIPRNSLVLQILWDWVKEKGLKENRFKNCGGEVI